MLSVAGRRVPFNPRHMTKLNKLNLVTRLSRRVGLKTIPSIGGKKPRPTEEKVTNRGFETGDTTGWPYLYGTVTVIAFDKYSGNYACRMQYSFPFFGGIRQDININASEAVSSGFWAKNLGAFDAMAGYYTDVGVGYYGILIPTGTIEWTWFDLISAIDTIELLGGVLERIAFSCAIASGSNDLRVDDVSLIAYI